ncbi:TPA: hypothetical protein DDZ86_02865 [Candidatus Dependentiae bacterium]|nr:hypothetical protein [Candidatus Dependentiae bacterium]
MKRIAASNRWVTRYLLPGVTAVFLMLLVGVAIHRFSRDSKLFTNQVLADQIELLADIFKKIDAKCKIIDFEHEKNFVDFLTVKSFVGSEVGSMNLTYPQEWEGPYMNDNVTVQEKLYVIVESNQGYYVAPGDGVKLANGKIIGKDIILDKHTDFEKLTKDLESLSYNDRPLARRIK